MKLQRTPKISAITFILILGACTYGNSNNTPTSANSPQGSWYNLAVIPLFQQDIAYVTSVTAYNNQVALGAKNSAPIVFTCQYQLNFCATNTISSFMPNGEAVNALKFDHSNNLWSSFASPSGGLYNTSSSYFYELFSTNNRWLYFNYNYGVYNAIDTASNGTVAYAGTTKLSGIPDGLGELLVITSFFPNDRSNWYYNYNAQSHTAVTSDGLSNLYIGGISSDPAESGAAVVWQFNSSASAFANFNKIQALPQFSAISTMTSNNNGILYIAATNFSYASEVWQYHQGVAKNLNFIGYQVSAMTYSAQGYLLVAGLDSSYQPQVFSYNPQIESWTSMNISDSPTLLTDITADPISNIIYVSGAVAGNIPSVWYFAESK